MKKIQITLTTTAEFSENGKKRYLHTKTWDESKPRLAIIMIAPSEASGIELGFVDRFSGTLIVTGTVSEVQSAVEALCEYTEKTLGFTVCPITKT